VAGLDRGVVAREGDVAEVEPARRAVARAQEHEP
jgi:hypothetical protein